MNVDRIFLLHIPEGHILGFMNMFCPRLPYGELFQCLSSRLEVARGSGGGNLASAGAGATDLEH